MSFLTATRQRLTGPSDYNRTAVGPFHRTYLTYAVVAVCVLIFLYEFIPSTRLVGGPPAPPDQLAGASPSFDETWNAGRDRRNLLLNDHQCGAVFPNLDHDVERAIRDRHGQQITVEEMEEVPRLNGYIRGMIYDQELFIIDKQGGIYSRELATLSALHRAIITSPEPLPDIEFTFNSDDKVASRATWAYARKEEDSHIWLLPDFGFWAWPETKVGSYNMVQQKAALIENGDPSSGRQPLPFEAKTDKLVWRGATMDLELRNQLIAESRDKSWSDVKAITWHNEQSMKTDLLSMEDHCRYKFVAHTEGNSYSGRLKYLQNCRSVVVAHTMDYIQHYTHLMVASGSEQNYVEVSRDFRDLDGKMNDLLGNIATARRIADKSVEVFRERYLTPAAQVCYLRKLIRGWASVSFEPQRFDAEGNPRGVPFEDYVLERRLKWDPY